MATGSPRPVYAALTDVLSVAERQFPGSTPPSLILVYSYMELWAAGVQIRTRIRRDAETFCNWWSVPIPERRLAARRLSSTRLVRRPSHVHGRFRMARRGRRRVVYAWAPRRQTKCSRTLIERYQADVVALHIDDLYDGLSWNRQMFEEPFTT